MSRVRINEECRPGNELERSLKQSEPLENEPCPETANTPLKNDLTALVKWLCVLWVAPGDVGEVSAFCEFLMNIVNATTVTKRNKHRVVDLRIACDFFRTGLIGLDNNQDVVVAMKEFEKARVHAVYAMHQVVRVEHKLLATKIILSCTYLEGEVVKPNQNALLATFDVQEVALKNLRDDKLINNLLKLERKGGFSSLFSKKSRKFLVRCLDEMECWVEANTPVVQLELLEKST